jgi:hypothetical protein
MNRHQLLIRTAKGQDEVLTNASNLLPRLRQLLILIDEHDTLDQTLLRLALLGDDLEAQLETLVADGFLAARWPVGDTNGLSADQWELFAAGLLDPRDLRPAGVPVPREPAFNLEKAKDFARVIVLESLCPVDAEHVERIDAARTAGELRLELDNLRETLPKLLPQHHAKQVWAQLEPLMLPLSADQMPHPPHPTRFQRWIQNP